MRDFIAFVLGNFTLTFLILGLIASAISLWRRRGALGASVVVEELFAYFLLFSIGIAFFYNFVFHVFFGDMAVEFIGWRQSPFQAEVGFASLGFSVVGFMAFRASLGVRAAAVVGPACFLLGAAGEHVYQMIVAHNFAPGNAGVIFYTDIAIPLIGFVFLWLEHRHGGESASPEGAPGEAVGSY
jgi:hypothetical protein